MVNISTIGKDFEFSDADFRFIAKFVRDKAGIVLAEHKKPMVYSRLVRRLRQLGIKKFSDYCSLLNSADGDEEVLLLINAITTNLTSFFREQHHFEHLAYILRYDKSLFASRRIRIWSAGCSVGMEVYSIAITIAQTIGDYKNWDIKLLATDIDTNVLAHGVTGEYSTSQIASLPPDILRKYFVKQQNNNYRLCQDIRNLVRFKSLNLMADNWPMRGKFQVIFCRNVMIYFDKSSQTELAHKFSNLLVEGGYLTIGHSENLFGLADKFIPKGHTIYQRLPDDNGDRRFSSKPIYDNQYIYD